LSGCDLDLGERALLATGTLGSFRACFGMREFQGNGSLHIDRLAAATLGVKNGDEVWSVAR